MKKESLIAFLILTASSLFAQKINYFTKEPVWTFENGMSLETGTNFGPVSQSTDFSTSVDFTELKLAAGFKVLPDSMDLTTQAVYWPTFFNHFNLGVGSILHLNKTWDIYQEADFLNGLFFKFTPGGFFNISCNLLHFSKASNIYAIEDEIPWLKNSNNMALGLDMNFYPKRFLNFYLSFASYSFYRYMLFFAPDFKLGAAFNLSKRFLIGTEFEFQYIDMFTLSANFNNADFRTYVKMVIK